MDWLTAALETRYIPLCTAAASCPTRAALSENDADKALEAPENATRSLTPESDAVEIPALAVFSPLVVIAAADDGEEAPVASFAPPAAFVSR